MLIAPRYAEAMTERKGNFSWAEQHYTFHQQLGELCNGKHQGLHAVVLLEKDKPDRIKHWKEQVIPIMLLLFAMVMK